MAFHKIPPSYLDSDGRALEEPVARALGVDVQDLVVIDTEDNDDDYQKLASMASFGSGEPIKGRLGGKAEQLQVNGIDVLFVNRHGHGTAYVRESDIVSAHN